MKKILLYILLLLTFTGVCAQQRDLKFYLEMAKLNSPLINKSKNENSIVKLDLQQINSVLSKPDISVQSGVMFAPIVSHDNPGNHFEWASEGATKYSGYDLAITNGGQYQAVISLKQPLLNGSKYKSYAHKAGISGQINENNIALTIHELEQVVGYQYLLCLKSKMQADNSLSLLQKMEEQLNTMHKLVENAIYKKTDYMLLQIEVQDFNSEHKMYRAEYRNNLYDLNLICGINDTAKVDLQDINFPLKPEKVVNSKFLTSYLLDSLNIVADQEIFELKYKPQFDLFAESGLNAAYKPSFNRLGFSTGVSLSWNIFDGRQRNLQRGKSTIKLQTIEFDKKNFLTQNDIGKNKILNQIDALDQRIQLAEQQSGRYDELYNAYTKELLQGEVSVMDFKNLIKDMAAEKQDIILLKIERQFLINAYNYLNY